MGARLERIQDKTEEDEFISADVRSMINELRGESKMTDFFWMGWDGIFCIVRELWKTEEERPGQGRLID